MTLGGAYGDEQPLRDLRVGQPVGHQVGDLQLPPGQRRGLDGRRRGMRGRRRRLPGRSRPCRRDRAGILGGTALGTAACPAVCVPAGARRSADGAKAKGLPVSDIPTTSQMPSAAPNRSAARSPRPSATATRPSESRPTAMPIRSPSSRLQDDGLTEQGGGLVEAARSQLVLTQPGHSQRLHVALPDLVRPGDALPMAVGRLPAVAGETMADPGHEERDQLASKVGCGPQQARPRDQPDPPPRRGFRPRPRPSQPAPSAHRALGRPSMSGGGLVPSDEQVPRGGSVVLQNGEPARRVPWRAHAPASYRLPLPAPAPASGAPRRATRWRTSRDPTSSPSPSRRRRHRALRRSARGRSGGCLAPDAAAEASQPGAVRLPPRRTRSPAPRTTWRASPACRAARRPSLHAPGRTARMSVSMAVAGVAGRAGLGDDDRLVDERAHQVEDLAGRQIVGSADLCRGPQVAAAAEHRGPRPESLLVRGAQLDRTSRCRPAATGASRRRRDSPG